MTDPTDLEARLRRLEDRAGLWDLVTRYAVAVDDEDYPTLEGLFADDAEFVGLSGSVTAGRDNIVAYLRDRSATAHKQRVHTPTSQIIDDLSDGRARGLVSCYAALFAYDGSESFFAFRYEDEYVQENGRWRFRRRRVHDVKHVTV